jgi:hypothetical protein
MDFGAMIDRVRRAAMLDVGLYQEVEADTSLNQEALIVVVLASIAAGIGGLVGSLLLGGNVGPGFVALIVAAVLGVVNYYIWSYLTYFVGTSLFDGTADPGELLRVLGYASGPRVLGVLSFIPCVGWVFGLGGAIWALVAGVIAVREALDFDTTKAILTVIIGWVVILVITTIVGTVLGVGAIGLGAVISSLSGR